MCNIITVRGRHASPIDDRDHRPPHIQARRAILNARNAPVNWSIVRGGTSSAQKALFFNLRRLRARLAQGSMATHCADPLQTIADALKLPRADVELMDARLGGGDASLNAQIHADDSSATERMDFLIDDSPLPDEIVENRLDQDRRAKWLRDALQVLTERELRILRERRLNEPMVTLEALGATLGISKERVRQIENRALGKLRRALSAQPGCAAPAN
jgi:RNA polymerase sigma-32 factor